SDVRTFVGRENELDLLRRAFDDTTLGNSSCLVIEGESGIGKSFLVRQFIERVRERAPRVAVVRGRCYENESMPYKAFDGAIESMVRQLRRVPIDELALLAPTELGALLQTFPMFRRVDWGVSDAGAATSSMDPLEIRSRAFSALREMFQRVAARTSL